MSWYAKPVCLDRARGAGAKGYLMKREATDHVITAIHTVLRGDIYVSDKWRDKLVNMFGQRGTTVAGSSPERLSNRELEVLQLTGQGYSTRQIADELH